MRPSDIEGVDYECFMRRVLQPKDPNRYSYGDVMYPIGIETGQHRAMGISYASAMKSLRSRVLKAVTKLETVRGVTVDEGAVIARCREDIEHASTAADIYAAVRVMLPIVLGLLPAR